MQPDKFILLQQKRKRLDGLPAFEKIDSFTVDFQPFVRGKSNHYFVALEYTLNIHAHLARRIAWKVYCLFRKPGRSIFKGDSGKKR